MLIVLLVLYMIYRWYRWEKDLKNMAWKINPSDLDYNVSKKLHSSMMSSRLAQSCASVDSNVSGYGTTRSIAPSFGARRQSLTRGQIFTTVAMYRGDIVAVKKSRKKKINHDRAFLLQMKHLSEMKHGNVTAFLGVCTTPEKICAVWEYCSKGSIQDVIQNDDIRLDTMFKLSMAVDICQGLDYIHKSPIKYHGNLRSSNCVIDSRWVCKLTDFGLWKLKVSQEQTEEALGEHAYYARLFWTAPEILRKVLNKEPWTGSQDGDVYALGILIKELLCRNEPYCAESHLSPKEIINLVAFPKDEFNIFRPMISDTELDTEYRRTNMEYLIDRCWSEDVERRPALRSILRTLTKINPYKKSSVVDNMISMMEKYTNNLEDIVAERTSQLQEEKRKTDALLYRMLPRKVAEDLKVGRSVQAEAFQSVTIYFSDIVQFTRIASESTPLEIVALLNALYTLFDDIVSHYDVYKVETIGDAYMIVSGLPERNGGLHVREISCVALDILESVLTFKMPHDPNQQLEIRIGLHTGPVVAGVVGLTMPRYCLFGDTVNTASRMESNGKPLRIHISSSTREGLRAYPDFQIEERGEIPIKGKGMMQTYWLTGLHHKSTEDQPEGNGFRQLIAPDNSVHSDVSESGDVIRASNFLRVNDPNTGKISVADSGISVDRCPHDRDTPKSCLVCCQELDDEAAIRGSSNSAFNQTGSKYSAADSNVGLPEIGEIREHFDVPKLCVTGDLDSVFPEPLIDEDSSDSDKHNNVQINQDFAMGAKRKSVPLVLSDLFRGINRISEGSVSSEEVTSPGYKRSKSFPKIAGENLTQTNEEPVEPRKVISEAEIKQRHQMKRNRVSWPNGPEGIAVISMSSDSEDGSSKTGKNRKKRKGAEKDGNVRKSSIFNPPARVSATDFMTVQKSWFQFPK